MTALVDLTEIGRAYAAGKAGDSIVARVALWGDTYDPPWPLEHVNLARRLMNAEGDIGRLDYGERVVLSWRAEAFMRPPSDSPTIGDDDASDPWKEG